MSKIRNNFFLIALLLFFLMNISNCSKTGANEIKAPGIVDGEIITLKAAVPGTLQQLMIKEGARITKDQVLVRVNADKIENQLLELDISSREIDINREKISKKLKFLDSNIQYLQKQVKRFRRLKKKKSIPGEQLETMELKLLEAETSRFDLSKTLEVLKVQKEKIENKREYFQLLLGDHVIKSPVDGVVIEKFISAGETVFPGTAIADILDTSGLYVEIFIEEKEMAGLTLNQEAVIHLDGIDKELTGIVSYFGKKAEFSPKYIISEKERQSLLYQVKIKVQDPSGMLKIGMPVTVVLERKKNEG
ncbi:MAG: efflux RND transporter periplasmic adaptor subunit [Candidatus Aminicenantes bacterium]|nr:MAG: efflux RND transporter periplasmic adaptor subunit [Candidatus Aminicenantes bacterium]